MVEDNRFEEFLFKKIKGIVMQLRFIGSSEVFIFRVNYVDSQNIL